jgi:hypothetical protein
MLLCGWHIDGVTDDSGPMVFAKKAHGHTFSMEKTLKADDSEYFFARQLEHSIPAHQLDSFERVTVTMKKRECSSSHHGPTYLSHEQNKPPALCFYCSLLS